MLLRLKSGKRTDSVDKRDGKNYNKRIQMKYVSGLRERVAL